MQISNRNAHHTTTLKSWLDHHLGTDLVLFSDLSDGIQLLRLLNIFEPELLELKRQQIGYKENFLDEFKNYAEKNYINTKKHTNNIFIQRERITLFLEVAKELNINQKDLFNTVDLNEMKNTKQVEITLFMLSMKLSALAKHKGKYFIGSSTVIDVDN